MENLDNINHNLSSLRSNINSLNNELNSLKADTTTSKEDIHRIKSQISGNLVWNFDNKGLDGVKRGKTLNGEDDYLFLDPYYDENGLPTYYINQFNPLFANLYRNFSQYKGSKFKDNGCNPASYTNAFIDICNVHSLIDTMGILSFFVSESNKEGGRLNENTFINLITGNKKREENSNYMYLKKYLTDDNGNYIFNSDTNFLKSDVQEGQYVIKNSSDLDQIINNLEEQGYIVDLSIGGVSFSPAWGMLGSNGDNGHYGAISYNTNGGISVLDSFGNRAFQYEREQEGFEYIGWTTHQYGENYNEGGRNGNPRASKVFRGTTDENTIWHETTVYLGTNFQSLDELANTTKLQRNGVVLLNIHRKEE